VLGAYDDYGIEFCRTFKSQCKHPAPNIWQVSNVDPEKLVRFWLAILWRFSISSLPEAALIQLGPYETRECRVLGYFLAARDVRW